MPKLGTQQTESSTDAKMADAYKFEAHVPKKRKNVSWPVCAHCGLIYLRNPFTDWAVRMGCNNNDHPNYQKHRMKTGFIL